MTDASFSQQIQRGGVKDLFASVAPLFHQVDATVINLECPATSVHSPLNLLAYPSVQKNISGESDRETFF